MKTLFSSKRERRLWLALVIVLVVIYATLGQVPEIARFLRARNDLRDATFFVFFISTVMVSVLFIRRRPGRAEIAVGVGILLIFLSAWLRMGVAERTHLFEYGLVGALIHEALLERRANRRRVPVPVICALALSICLGWVDESIQSTLPNRYYDTRDVFFNGFAAGMVIGARWLLALVRRWT